MKFEMVFDLMCGDCANEYPTIKEFLAMDFLGTTVKDAITLTYTYSPLPYHHGVWIPHKMVPYILDQCLEDESACLFEEYQQYAIDNQQFMLNAKDQSQDELIPAWVDMVTQALGIEDQKDAIMLEYDRDTEEHDTENRMRLSFKYALSKGVTTTPTVFVNEVMLGEIPETAEEWYTL
eukprot:CAMPEP_0170542138 /NCGR_PEP_ID=MMETSP0211-20121228/1663_1 /TAXON_ID=311385 /ORGANISM="Pseudokeronopsis sp., Strain OXSARD2" /LENGTH=177 /DNA_ID=CAMNT_0010845107 /DNA_START=137 /DNA_END=667 /DNA_ORIENTATION=-